MKKLFILLLVGFVIFIPTKVYANDKEPINIYVFYGSTCPYCHALFEWFDSIEEDYGYMYKMNKYEVWEDTNNAELMNLTTQAMKIDISGVPLLIIGNGYLDGFDEEAYADAIKEAIKEEFLKEDSERIDIVAEVINNTNWTPSEEPTEVEPPSQKKDDQVINKNEKKKKESEPIYKNNYFRLFAVTVVIVAIILIGKKTIYIS